MGALLATLTGLIVLGPDLLRLPSLLAVFARHEPWRLLPLLPALYLTASSARLRGGGPGGRRPPGEAGR